MSFYRTYRPQVIDEIDNVHVREELLSLLAKPKKDLPHAFLFTGPRGGGKTTAARLVAKLFNCQKPVKEGPCGKCDQCVSIAEGRNLDVLELDAASNRGIDEIRTLRDGIALSPASASYKIYIIDEVHMLTTEAFNALLKTLEEPPVHAVFVLATTDAQKVPVTIKSRCASVSFAKATAGELTHALKRIVKKEKIAIDDGALKLIAVSADGSFRDAVKLLEQASFHKGSINEETLRTLLSLISNVDIEEFTTAVLARDTKHCLALIQKVSDAGIDMKTFVIQSLTELHQRLLADVANKDLKEAIQKFSTAYTELRGSAIPQLPIELAVIEYCQEENVIPASPAGRRDTKDVIREEKKQENNVSPLTSYASPSSGTLTIEKLTDHWADVIAELKPYNHSVAGVMRSTRPVSVKDGIVTIEAFYTFHKDKLSETKTREVIGTVLKKLFGEKVGVEIVLGKK